MKCIFVNVCEKSSSTSLPFTSFSVSTSISCGEIFVFHPYRDCRNFPTELQRRTVPAGLTIDLQAEARAGVRWGKVGYWFSLRHRILGITALGRGCHQLSLRCLWKFGKICADCKRTTRISHLDIELCPVCTHWSTRALSVGCLFIWQNGRLRLLKLAAMWIKQFTSKPLAASVSSPVEWSYVSPEGSFDN